ncbi:2-amino-4-hydroxy-6-hydroxymethyldihydropteridine diphosphokinase, partial [Mesorhizobium sp. M7A.T.Ca.TU.009.01.1.1]
ILVFGDRVIHETGLEVPHPRMLERAFVLAPLAEIAPGLVVSGRSITDRLVAVDTSGIERLSSGRDWWLA